LNSSAAWQLAFGLVTVLVIYVLASGAKRTLAIGVLLVMIPFQTVDTKYASSSVLIAYAMAGVLLLNGGIRVRLLPALAGIVFAYLISLSQADRSLFSYHALFVFQFFSCLVVFLLAYNYAVLAESERAIVDILFVTNVVVVVYCVLQLSAGPGESFVPFGIDALKFNENRFRFGTDARLVGPFANPGSTAGYFTIMILVCAVELIRRRDRRRWPIQTLIALNVIGLIATGNRAAFLILLAMFPLTLLAFRRELGAQRIAKYLVGGFLVLVVTSAVAVSVTGFDRMFDRLATVTETENGVPVTRADTWPVTIAKIEEHPWVGWGPFFVDPATATQLGWSPDQVDPYPHSLYLYLWRTVGALGLIAMIWFFLAAWRALYLSLRRVPELDERAAFSRLGLLVIPAFLIAQITLEFSRPSTMDYAQFVFALVGLLVGVSDRSDALARTQTVRTARAGEESLTRGEQRFLVH
jgi:O-antigen ligase